MADFSTSAELSVSVTDQELAGVRQQIERELSNINVGVSGGVGGGQPRNPQTGRFMSPQGGEQRLVDLANLAERRNVLLQQIQDTIEQAAVTEAQAGGGGGGAGQTLLQVAGAQSILGGLGIGGAASAGAGGLGILAGAAGPGLLVEALLGTEQVTSNLLGGDGGGVSPQTSNFFGGRPEWFDSTPTWWDEEPAALGSMTPEDPAPGIGGSTQRPEDPSFNGQTITGFPGFTGDTINGIPRAVLEPPGSDPSGRNMNVDVTVTDDRELRDVGNEITREVLRNMEDEFSVGSPSAFR